MVDDGHGFTASATLRITVKPFASDAGGDGGGSPDDFPHGSGSGIGTRQRLLQRE